MITPTKKGEKEERESVRFEDVRTKLFPSAFCFSFSLSLFSFSRNILTFLALLANRKVRELFFTDMHLFQCGALSWIGEKVRKIFNNDDDLDKGRFRVFFGEKKNLLLVRKFVHINLMKRVKIYVYTLFLNHF